MPLYVYKCDDCGVTFEKKQSVSESPLRICPECEGTVRRVIQPVGVVFNGSGFYITDNRSRSSTTSSGGSKDSRKSESSSDDNNTGTTSKSSD